MTGTSDDEGLLDDDLLDDDQLGDDDDLDGPPSRRCRVLGLPVAVVVPVVLGVVMVLLIALLATREPASNRQVASPLIGQPAPRIVGETTAGRPFDSATYDGRWLVVNYFATWCLPCVREHPELIEFQRTQLEAGRANLISVVFDDDEASVQRFFDRNGGDWPVVLAAPETISQWGVAGVPESFIVDPSGVVRYKLIGGVTAEGLSALVEP